MSGERKNEGGGKKVLIATWVECDNYGSLLQAYCLQEMMRELGRDAEVKLLNYCSSKENEKRFIDKVMKIQGGMFREIPNKVLVKVLQKIGRRKMMERCRKFAEFREKELNLYPKNAITGYTQLNNLKKFDLYVAGSDQIWNPKLLGGGEYLLSWVPKGVTKISYASSVCVNHLTKTELKKYQILDSFKALSVREYTEAVEQISGLIHKKITEVCDPVILYGRERLLRMCTKNGEVENYAAIYLLNGSKKRHGSYVDFLNRKGWVRKVIPTTKSENLPFELGLDKSLIWAVGPKEFIDLIYNSKMVITDSYHAMIIALLLHKNFAVLPREEGRSEQNNRIIRLLASLGLENRCGVNTDLRPIDWEKVDKKIARMKKMSKKFLADAVKDVLLRNDDIIKKEDSEKMEQYKVSIIVAVYKHEKFIRKCIESIINQTYKNLEIILVDDGTPLPDRSGEICDEYARMDKRIKVIHKKNGGCCEARNFGLKKVTGDFVSIVDGDDWMEPDYVEYLMRIIQETGAEMSLTTNIFTTRDREQVKNDKITVWTPEEAVANMIYPVVPIGPWNKMISVRLIREYNLSFCTPWSGEGLYFTVMAAQRASKIGVGRRKVYDYRLNNTESGLTNYNVQIGINALDCIMNYTARDVIFDTPLVRNAIKWHVWKNHHFLLRLIVATNGVKEYDKLYKECIQNIRRDMLDVMLHSRISPRSKAAMIIKTMFPVWNAKRALRKERAALEKDVKNDTGEKRK